MNEHPTNHDKFAALSNDELMQETEQAFDALGKWGYDKIDIPGLLLSTRYRLLSLVTPKIMAIQDENKRAVTEEEREQVWTEVLKDNPRYSGPVLVESLRYQLGYDYKDVAELHQYSLPAPDEEGYLEVVTAFDRLGQALEAVVKRFPDQRPREFLPAKLRRYS